MTRKNSWPIATALLGALVVLAALAWWLRRTDEVDALPVAPVAQQAPAETHDPPPELPVPPVKPLEPATSRQELERKPPLAMGGGQGPRKPIVVRVIGSGGEGVPGTSVAAWTRDIEHPFANELKRGKDSYVARFVSGPVAPTSVPATSWAEFVHADPTWGPPHDVAETDEQGACTLSLPGGVATIVATKQRLSSETWIADPWQAVDAPLVLTLHPMAQLDIQVVDAMDDPLSGAIVYVETHGLFLQGVRQPIPARTDGEGRCSVNVDTSITVVVCAQLGAAWSSRQVAFIQQSIEGPLVVRVGTPYAIEGTVVDPRGSPVAAAVVRGRGPSSEVEATISDADGHFRLPVGEQGEWLLGATANGWTPASIVTALVDRAGPPPTARVPVGLPGHIAGRVVWPDATPAAGIAVAVSGTGGFGSGQQSPFEIFWSPTTTDDDGLFAIGNLPTTGTYTVYAYGGAEPIEASLAHRVKTGQDVEIQVSKTTIAGRLSGTVVDGATGAAVPEFAVRLTTSAQPAGEVFGEPTWRSIRNDQGAFQLMPGAMKTGFLWVSASGYTPSRQGPITFGADETTLQVALSRL